MVGAFAVPGLAAASHRELIAGKMAAVYFVGGQLRDNGMGAKTGRIGTFPSRLSACSPSMQRDLLLWDVPLENVLAGAFCRVLPASGNSAGLVETCRGLGSNTGNQLGSLETAQRAPLSARRLALVSRRFGPGNRNRAGGRPGHGRPLRLPAAAGPLRHRSLGCRRFI